VEGFERRNLRHTTQNTIQNRKQAAAWQDKYNAHAPKVGGLAPDFELRDVNGANPVRLSQFWGHKPVALLFGSHT